ncbi:hypothetical protein F5Y15DRAFT_212728 [Xylariaceae sp. FL0016]|nr:hypothetical protein F5Y15DRAFT_212728 [Xylariaceae sp. FL0016]
MRRGRGKKRGGRNSVNDLESNTLLGGLRGPRVQDDDYPMHGVDDTPLAQKGHRNKHNHQTHRQNSNRKGLPKNHSHRRLSTPYNANESHRGSGISREHTHWTNPSQWQKRNKHRQQKRHDHNNSQLQHQLPQAQAQHRSHHHHHRRASLSSISSTSTILPPTDLSDAPYPPSATSTSSRMRFCTECRDVRRANIVFHAWARAVLREARQRLRSWSAEVGVGRDTGEEMDWQPEPVVRVLILESPVGADTRGYDLLGGSAGRDAREGSSRAATGDDEGGRWCQGRPDHCSQVPGDFSSNNRRAVITDCENTTGLGGRDPTSPSAESWNYSKPASITHHAQWAPTGPWVSRNGPTARAMPTALPPQICVETSSNANSDPQ